VVAGAGEGVPVGTAATTLWLGNVSSLVSAHEPILDLIGRCFAGRMVYGVANSSRSPRVNLPGWKAGMPPSGFHMGCVRR
jgi:hypothetical protein